MKNLYTKHINDSLACEITAENLIYEHINESLIHVYTNDYLYMN